MFAGAGSNQDVSQHRRQASGLSGNAEIRPVDMSVRPGWMPYPVEIEPVVRCSVPRVRVGGVERDGDNLAAVRERHHASVAMYLVLAVLVRRIDAPGFASGRPEDTAGVAYHDRADVGHEPNVRFHWLHKFVRPGTDARPATAATTLPAGTSGRDR
jgi:hypothetical protein